MSGDRGTSRVAKWRDGGGPSLRRRAAADAAGAAPEAVRRAFSLSRQPFDDLVDGVEMDLRRSRYETFDELVEYCRRVASAVGLMCIEMFGCRDPRSREYAFNLGLALQITNIIRDIKADLTQGRVYLPQEDLARFGVTEAGAGGRRRHRRDPAAAALRMPARAREFYTRGRAGDAARPSRASWWPPRSWAASTSRSCSASSGAATTCSRERVRVPKLQRARDRAADLDAQPLSAFGRHAPGPGRLAHDARRDRHWRRLRRAWPPPPRWSRRARACWSSKRGPGSAAAPRRSPIRQPASASTTASTS